MAFVLLLALLAALFSLFTASKLLVLSVPFLAMYLLLDLSAAVNLWDGKLNVWAVYQPFLNPSGRGSDQCPGTFYVCGQPLAEQDGGPDLGNGCRGAALDRGEFCQFI